MITIQKEELYLKQHQLDIFLLRLELTTVSLSLYFTCLRNQQQISPVAMNIYKCYL